MMPGRKYSVGSGYRYGFNGKENNNEVYSGSNDYDYGDRIYNPRLGLWLSVDKLQAKHAGESPYLFVGGSPIVFVDPDGRDRIIYLTVTTSKGTFTVLTKHTDIGVYKKVMNKLYIWGQWENNLYDRTSTINIDLTKLASGKYNEVMTSSEGERYAGKETPSLYTKTRNFLNTVTAGEGSFQKGGYNFTGNDNGTTLDLKDKAGTVYGSVDMSAMFGFMASADNALSVKELFKKVADENTMEKFVSFAEKVNTLIKTGVTTAAAIEETKKNFKNSMNIVSIIKKNIKDGKPKYCSVCSMTYFFDKKTGLWQMNYSDHPATDTIKGPDHTNEEPAKKTPKK